MLAPAAGERVAFNEKKVYANIIIHLKTDEVPFDNAWTATLNLLHMKAPTGSAADIQAAKDRCKELYDLGILEIKTKIELDKVNVFDTEFDRRHREHDMHQDGPAFQLDPQPFAVFKFKGMIAYRISHLPANATLLPEYLRLAMESLPARNMNNQLVEIGVQETVLRFSHLFAEAPLVSNKHNPKKEASLVLWMCVYDRKDLPLNPIVCRLFSIHEIYSVGYQSYPLPPDVKTLLTCWCNHVSRIRTAMFSDLVVLVTNPKTTLREVFTRIVNSRQHVDEFVCTMLAFQYLITRTVEAYCGSPTNIDVQQYWNWLYQVDTVARKFKAYYHRDRIAIAEISTGTDFNVPEMHVSAINEFAGSATVEKFVRKLRAAKTGEKLDDDESPVKVKKDPSAGSASPKGFPCNFCKVKTDQHRGSTCPWKAAGKTAQEVAKLSLADRIAGPL